VRVNVSCCSRSRQSPPGGTSSSVCFIFLLDSRLTTNHGVVAVLVGGRAIAWKATDASLDDTVVGVGGILGDALVVLVGCVDLLLDERVAWVIVVFMLVGCDLRLTTKHGCCVVVFVVVCVVAWKATNAALDDTVFGGGGVCDVLVVLVLANDLLEERQQ